MTDTLTTIVGNLVGTPTLRRLESGRCVATLRVACTESTWNNDSGGFVDGRTSFFNVNAWGSLGENAVYSFEKGHRVVVHGKLYVNQYTTKEGENRYSVEIDARALGHDVQFGTTKFAKTQYVREPASATAEEDLPPGQHEQSLEPDYVEIDGVFVDADGARVG